MREALHIFRKDLRRLWPLTGLVLLLVAAYAVLAVRGRGESMSADIVSVLVPAAYAWLIVTLVHQEALAGDRQFWLTRPYRLGSLLAAKVLFVALFVTGSMAAKDCAIAAAVGLPISLPGLLLRLIAWTAWVSLPALAIATVTRNLGEIGLAGAAIALAYAVNGTLERQFPWESVEWVRDAAGVLLLLFASCVIVLWQYFRRDTLPARVAAACGAILLIVALPRIPWRAAFDLETLGSQADVRLIPDLSRHVRAPAQDAATTAPINIALPVRVEGASGLIMVADGVKVEILSGKRPEWRSEWQHFSWYAVKTGPLTSEMFSIDRAAYLSLRDRPLTVRLSLALSLFEDQPPTEVPTRARSFVYKNSRCDDWAHGIFPPRIVCEPAFRELPQTWVALDTGGGAMMLSRAGTSSYAPYPAILGQSPLTATPLPILPNPEHLDAIRAQWEAPGARLILTPQRPVAHFSRELEFTGVRLGDYAVPTPRAVLRAYPETPLP